MNNVDPQAPLLELRGIARRFALADGGELTVLRGLDLAIRAGEMVGLVGPSGSGKSSLLHLAGLLESPNAGAVYVRGADCTGMTDDGRTALRLSEIGFIYQFHHLLAEFSALDNVAMPQMIAGVSRSDAQARAELLLTRLGLAGRLAHQPSQMSGGEQQRVAIARAMANRPKLLIADEPTGNLDPATSAQVFQSLQTLVREDGVAALVATHNMALASHMDRVLTLRDGRLEDARPAIP